MTDVVSILGLAIPVITPLALAITQWLKSRSPPRPKSVNAATTYVINVVGSPGAVVNVASPVPPQGQSG